MPAASRRLAPRAAPRPIQAWTGPNGRAWGGRAWGGRAWGGRAGAGVHAWLGAGGLGAGELGAGVHAWLGAGAHDWRGRDGRRDAHQARIARCVVDAAGVHRPCLEQSCPEQSCLEKSCLEKSCLEAADIASSRAAIRWASHSTRSPSTRSPSPRRIDEGNSLSSAAVAQSCRICSYSTRFRSMEAHGRSIPMKIDAYEDRRR